jgi:4-hydroxythreonine-4-phosphate dehydrogenase
LACHPGLIRVDASRAAHTWICEAVTACRAGILDAMVTAPISKEGFARAGIDVPGHTELLADLTRTRRFAMMLFGGCLRVTLVTRHVPLRRVPAMLTRPRIRQAIELTHAALPWLGVARSRIAVCGLNPHAGDGGTIGTEEQTVIAPVIRSLRRKHLDVLGPVPADTVFHEAHRGDYDAVVAMYHDQGLGPLKMLAFDTGVNLTLGLPIVRTSPDHGTAFAIAGTGTAREGSMLEAIKTAHRLALQPNPWVRGKGRRA